MKDMGRTLLEQDHCGALRIRVMVWQWEEQAMTCLFRIISGEHGHGLRGCWTHAGEGRWRWAPGSLSQVSLALRWHASSVPHFSWRSREK